MTYVLKYRLFIAPITVPIHQITNSQYRVPDSAVVDVSTGQTTTIDFLGGASIGVTSPPEASVDLIKNAAQVFTSRTFNWRMANVVVYFSTDGVNYYTAFAGFLDSRTESLNTVKFSCKGYGELLKYYKHATPLWKDKPVSTAIPDIPAASSTWSIATSGLWGQYAAAQDPTTLDGSFVGTVNTVFWLLGGRPYKYKDHYVNNDPVARFWYDCDHAPIVPKFTWLNQENISDDLVSLVSAAGGQLLQTRSGILKCINPHSFVPATNPTYVVNDSMFSSLTFDEDAAVGFSKVIVTFSPRFLGANKSVLDSPIGKYLPYNEEYTHEIELQQPVDRLTNNTYYGSGITFAQSGGYFGIDEFIESRDFIKAVDYNGDTATVSLKIPQLSPLYFPKRKYNWTGDPATSNWTYERDVTKTPGQFLKVIVKNRDAARALYLSKISLFGVPIVAGDTQTIKQDIPLEFPDLINTGIIPSGFREARIQDNEYVQSRDQAQRLLDVVKYLHKRFRPVITISDLVFNPSVGVGDIITINSLAYNIINKKHKVTEVQVNKTGAYMNITCVDVSDIKTREEFFVVGETYAANATRYLSW